MNWQKYERSTGLRAGKPGSEMYARRLQDTATPVLSDVATDGTEVLLSELLTMWLMVEQYVSCTMAGGVDSIGGRTKSDGDGVTPGIAGSRGGNMPGRARGGRGPTGGKPVEYIRRDNVHQEINLRGKVLHTLAPYALTLILAGLFKTLRHNRVCNTFTSKTTDFNPTQVHSCIHLTKIQSPTPVRTGDGTKNRTKYYLLVVIRQLQVKILFPNLAA